MREGENVQDEQQDILYRAAEVWKELTEYHYVFTYGYKGELHEIKLTFSPEDFPHLAGVHYLKDIALPRYSPRKTVDMILSGKITYDKVKKGALYQEYVKPRLLALVRLKEILEQEFDLFSYLSMICQDSGRHSRQAQRNRMETDGHIGGGQMRKSAPIKVIVHHPTTEVGKRELAGRVADVHAEFVIHTISKLDCPLKQKLELLQVVIDTTKKRIQAKDSENIKEDGAQ